MPSETPEERELSLSNLKPAQKRQRRKRIGRGLASGKGRYSGRGIKGQKSRAGSHSMRPGFEGGQMPLYMRLGKQRGSTSKDAMPVGPHRTHTIPVNLADLERVFDDGAEVTLEALLDKRLIRNTRTDVKILGNGELKKKLTVTAHRFSKTAAEKIEAAGGTATALRPPREVKRRAPKKLKPEEPADEVDTPAADEPAASETEPAEPENAGEPDENGEAEAPESEA
jgi:large subunit ribosomal protein L15